MTKWLPAREQAIALGALILLLAACGSLAGWSVQAWSDAQETLSDKRAVLARLSRAAVPAKAGGGPARARPAPAAAFLEAPTRGQAGAQLEAYLTRLALAQNAVVLSSGIEPERKGEPDAIRLQATVETSLTAMQALLFALESGTPYLVVESLSVQASNGAAPGGVQDAPLRVNLILRGLWRRGSA